MSTAHLTVVVTNIATVITLFDRIKIYRSTVGIDGPYVELSNPATRPALSSAQTIYVFDDTDSDDDYYYKSSYFNTTTLVESSLSDPMQGNGEPAFEVISVADLKQNELFGIPLVDHNGNALPDSVFQHHIRAAVGWVSRALDLRLTPTALTERIDYDRRDYAQWIFLRLPEYPVISIDSVELIQPSTGETIIDFESGSWQLDDKFGHLRITPGPLSLGVATGVPFASPWGWPDLVPLAFKVSFVAGFAYGKLPAEILDVVSKKAAVSLLNILGDFVLGPGIAQERIGIDSLYTDLRTNQSAAGAAYGARIREYNKEIKEDIKMLREYYKGIMVQAI